MFIYLGKNIKVLRKSEGMTQLNLADKLGLRKVTISTYEQERSVPSFDVLIKIAEIFKVSLDDLVFRDIATEGRSAGGLKPIDNAETVHELLEMLRHRVRELEREIRKKDPDMAKDLGIK